MRRSSSTASTPASANSADWVRLMLPPKGCQINWTLRNQSDVEKVPTPHSTSAGITSQPSRPWLRIP